MVSGKLVVSLPTDLSAEASAQAEACVGNACAAAQVGGEWRGRFPETVIAKSRAGMREGAMKQSLCNTLREKITDTPGAETEAV